MGVSIVLKKRPLQAYYIMVTSAEEGGGFLDERVGIRYNDL